MDDWNEKAVSVKAMRAAAQSMKFLHDFQRRIDGGRPTGSRKGEVWSRQKCLQWWAGWTLDREPTRHDLAADMHVRDPETAVERWRDTGLGWHPTEEQLSELGEGS